MKLKYLTLLLFIGLVFTSCNKDKEAPSINISSPSNNLAVDPGGSFLFKVTITDNEVLNSINFTDGGGINETISTFDEINMHELNYNITINEDSDPGELTITVTATDDEGNSANEDVTVVIQ
jgi:hypothetical protein